MHIVDSLFEDLTADPLLVVLVEETSAGGGAIYCSDTALIIENSVFRRCVSLASGGALSVVSSSLSIYTTVFEDNVATFYGGAVAARGLLIASNFEVFSSLRFFNNSAESGGAIYYSAGHLRVRNSEMVGNRWAKERETLVRAPKIRSQLAPLALHTEPQKRPALCS